MADALDLPAGAVINNVLLLTPARVSGKGELGGPGGGPEVPAGTRFEVALMTIDPAKRDDLRKAYGFDGPTPYALDVTQGRLERTAYILHMAAANHGVAGVVRAAKPGVGGLLPVRASGINPRWPVGAWRPADGTNAPAVFTTYACFEGKGVGQLDVSRNGPFYFGNLIVASDENLDRPCGSPRAPAWLWQGHRPGQP